MAFNDIMKELLASYEKRFVVSCYDTDKIYESLVSDVKSLRDLTKASSSTIRPSQFLGKLTDVLLIGPRIIPDEFTNLSLRAVKLDLRNIPHFHNFELEMYPRSKSYTIDSSNKIHSQKAEDILKSHGMGRML